METRYKKGGNSGAGSYNHLAVFKAEVINALAEEHAIKDLIEFGCGDGNQLSLLRIPNYTGMDVSSTVLMHCIKKFGSDKSKSFFLYDPFCFEDNQGVFKRDCSISLDVLFHLVEFDVYERYLKNLFNSSRRIVIIYAADIETEQISHELYRRFTKDIDRKFHDWTLDRVIKNRFPVKDYEDQEGSLCDFFVYKRK